MQDKPSKTRSFLIAGAVIGVVSAIPGLNLINCCCCAGVILGGVLSVYLYKQEFTPEMQYMEATDAVVLGVMSGLVAAFTALILEQIILAMLGDVAAEFVRSVTGNIIERMESSGSIPPETVDQLKSEIEKSMTESQTVTGVLKNLVVSLIIDPLFALLGALIGYSLFKPKKKIDETVPPQVQQ